MESNEWCIGFNNQEQVTVKICQGVVNEQSATALTCPLVHLHVNKEVKKLFGRHIQNDFDNFLINLKKEDAMFKTGGVVAIRLRN